MKPIIFIPGIEATALVNSNSFDFEMVWNAYDTLGTSLATKITGPYIEDKLLMNPIFDERMDAVIERNHIARLPYEKTFQNLVVKLRDKNDPSPIYLFGYDWRKSNDLNGERLFVFAQYIKGKILAKGESFEGFRFITHSMGALVLSCYLTQLRNNFEDIGRILLCAPPFAGSPYALVHMIKGDGGFKSFLNSLFGRNEDIRKVVRTYPSLFELVPFYHNAICYDDNQQQLNLFDIEQWQSTIYDDIRAMFLSRLQNLKKFRTEQLCKLDTLPPDLRARMMVVAGSDDRTLVGLNVLREHRGIKNFVILDDKDRCVFGSGDGTVPVQSSTVYKDAVRTLLIPKRSVFHEVSDNIDYHGLFLRDSRIQNILIRFISDEQPARVPSRGNTIAAANRLTWWESAADGVLNISPF